ncbi:hypothetical protein EV421DRAFT_1912756 [Armillaria borealis]|uniref:Uncharacterized protein n=1 Tax=Armillaria borealis TaxID=47425 RepID=A0AA39IU55_9AGAR|nr:hypothetical protein EV421DRAFT_1912756 [Armillaria borealis]
MAPAWRVLFWPPVDPPHGSLFRSERPSSYRIYTSQVSSCRRSSPYTLLIAWMCVPTVLGIRSGSSIHITKATESNDDIDVIASRMAAHDVATGASIVQVIEPRL